MAPGQPVVLAFLSRRDAGGCGRYARGYGGGRPARHRATRPVRRFLHNVFCPDLPRLNPMPIPAEAMARSRCRRWATTQDGGPRPAASGDHHRRPTRTPDQPDCVGDRSAMPMPAGSRLRQEMAKFCKRHSPPTSTRLAPRASYRRRRWRCSAPRPAETAATVESASDAPPGPPVHVVCEKSIRSTAATRRRPLRLSAVEAPVHAGRQALGEGRAYLPASAALCHG